MKKIIVFRKYGRLRFVGHLDMMRAFQRALRRAEIPLAYSQGFNPHPLMSFANPLPLGFEGCREIMEISLEKEMSDAEVLQRLAAQLPEGLTILFCRDGQNEKGEAMARVKAAQYRILLPEIDERTAHWDAFLQQEKILVTKLGKVRGRKQKVEVDIKPWIYEAALNANGELRLLCACGSEENLKPDLLVQAFYDFIGQSELQFEEQIIRESILTGTKDSFLPLEMDETL